MPPVSLLVALADATRCQIIAMLCEGPMPVHALAAGFPISRPAISRHLRVLKQAGLISEDKQGRENLYRLHPDALVPVRDWVANFLAVGQPAASVPVTKRPKATSPVPPIPKVVVRPRKPGPASQMGFDF